MSLTTANIPAFVIRKSENRNSFGLRGYWVLLLNNYDIFEFGDHDEHDKGALIELPCYAPAARNGHDDVTTPAKELARYRGRVQNQSPEDIAQLLEVFSPELPAQYITATTKATA